MELDEGVRSSSAAVPGTLQSFFAAEIFWGDVDWWSEHPYEMSPNGRVSPWQRIPELERHVFSRHAPADGDETSVAELRDLEDSLRRFRQAYQEALQPQPPSTPSDDSSASSEVVAPSPEERASSPAASQDRPEWSRRRRFAVAAAGVGVLSLALLVTQQLLHEEVGLQVFDRSQSAADTTEMTNVPASIDIPDSSRIIPDSTRLLTERYGYSFFAGRAVDGGVCVLFEKDGSGGADCVPEKEFVNGGLTTDFRGYIMVADRPRGFQDGDLIQVKWTDSQSEPTFQPGPNPSFPTD